MGKVSERRERKKTTTRNRTAQPKKATQFFPLVPIKNYLVMDVVKPDCSNIT